ncbi:MAG: 5-dehydro-2-deoxygluconokinase [Propionibacteriaceae bacterium]|nr:5-dehydro-2-deoxygluconokinase [Propionibacteriaceae bacterium]
MDGVREVLVVGRCSVDVYPVEVGVHLEEVETFRKFLGGSATNVAVACCRYGRTVTAVTGVGDDPFGRYVVQSLERCGVDASHVFVHPELNTPVTFCEIFPPDNFPLYFYRDPSTPDFQVSPDHLPVGFEKFPIIWLTASGLSVEPSRETHRTIARADREGLLVFDLDYRERFWDDELTASAHIGAMVEHADVAIGNLEECRIAVGETDPDRAADALLERGVDIAIVKQGPIGTLAKTRTERTFVPATPIEVINGLGAGDAFGGAICHALLSGWDLSRTIQFASAAGAIVASKLETSPAMPAEQEVLDMMDRFPEACRRTETTTS